MLPPLTEYERQLMELVGKSPRLSDTKIREALGVNQETLLRLANSTREKLGLAPGASLRAKARALAK